MDDIRCDLCLYWDNSSCLEANPDTGMCRRFPPGFDDRTGQAVWPFTEDADWCGKFAPKAKR